MEEFIVDDQDRNLPEAEHDRIAAEVARTVTCHPILHEVTEKQPAPEPRKAPEPEETQTERTTDDQATLAGDA